MDIWKNYFNTLLNVETQDEEGSIAGTDYHHVQPFVEEPTKQEIEEALKSLKNNKAPGVDEISAEMLKEGGQSLLRQMYKLILDIWREEKLPEEWKEAIIVPILKKGDKQDPNNYRGISLLSTSYKLFSKIVQRRIEVYSEEIIEDHQAGFVRGRSTSDQIFVVKESIAKYWEYNKEFYGIFIDFCKAYDSLDRDKIWQQMDSFGIPRKLINLACMCLNDSRCKVRIENDCTDYFDVKSGVRQGDGLSPVLFNLALEAALKKVRETKLGIKIGTDISILAFADDVVILAESQENINEMTEILINETNKVGLKINDKKTKVVHFRRLRRNDERTFKINQHEFEYVQEFKYLGVIVNSYNNEEIEIQSRINAATRSLYASNKLMSSKILSHYTKLKIYKTIIRPILLYGAETWILTKKSERNAPV